MLTTPMTVTKKDGDNNDNDDDGDNNNWNGEADDGIYNHSSYYSINGGKVDLIL